MSPLILTFLQFVFSCCLTYSNPRLKEITSFNPPYLNISIHILRTLRYTFPSVLTRRIKLTIRVPLFKNNFPYSHDLNEWLSRITFLGEIKCQSLLGFNPFTPKISLLILLTVCYTVLVMLTWRIWYWINL